MVSLKISLPWYPKFPSSPMVSQIPVLSHGILLFHGISPSSFPSPSHGIFSSFPHFLSFLFLSLLFSPLSLVLHYFKFAFFDFYSSLHTFCFYHTNCSLLSPAECSVGSTDPIRSFIITRRQISRPFGIFWIQSLKTKNTLSLLFNRFFQTKIKFNNCLEFCRMKPPVVSSACCFVPLLFLLLDFQFGHALRASVNYVPQGSNPLLYQPGVDPILHLDQSTFADTVFEPSRDNAIVVEFYADWCGHCRAFAPFYRQFASLVKRWSDVVQVAAVNCADTFNGQICRSNSVAYFPMIKYFPRSAASVGDGILMESAHSGTNLRDQLSSKILNEYNRFVYSNWPNLRHLEVNVNTRFEDLWQSIEPSANFLLIIFEQFDSVGVQSILDLWPNRQQIGVRRALSNSPLVPMLGIKKFPYVAMFKRDDQQSIFMDQFQGAVTLDEAMQRVQPGNFISLDTEQQKSTQSVRPHVDVIDCERFPDRCKQFYFVSETDLLKAIRMALLDEVTRMDEVIRADRFRRLYNFVVLLFEHFPVKTFDQTNETMRRVQKVAKRSPEPNTLQRSGRARQVFAHLKQFLEGKPEIVTAREWRNQFENVERVFGSPFPSNASWQHCAGSSPEFRGYTCGLWTIFHALTVHAYMDGVKERLSFNPLQPLRAIQGWVSTFFGCEHCRRHFMKMTTELFPMNEQRVNRLHDMVMYLWRAHNIVNARLHGDVTEDPQFVKYQFPPLFLCPTCHSGGHFSRRQTRNFLLRYYGSIRPYHRTHSMPESRLKSVISSRSRN